MPKIFDISPPIQSELAVFPGDTAFARNMAMDFKNGDHLSLSSITSTLHIGAHADAPSHYHKDGISIDQCDLGLYMGRCQVVDVSYLNSAEINLNNLRPVDILAPRVLFKTASIQNLNAWQEDFSFLSPEVIRWLAEKNVKLVGIDTPSMDHSKSKTMDGHQAFYKCNLAILEGLVLDAVSAGLYHLIALPLKIVGGEASPVRAVLLSGELS